jgi:hypothetical protein
MWSCPVQARGLRGRQAQNLIAPALHGAVRNLVAAGESGRALVVPQQHEHDLHDAPGRARTPLRLDLRKVAAS